MGAHPLAGRLERYGELTVADRFRISSQRGSPGIGDHMFDVRIAKEDPLQLKGDTGGSLQRDTGGQGGANPEVVLIEAGKELRTGYREEPEAHRGHSQPEGGDIPRPSNRT